MHNRTFIDHTAYIFYHIIVKIFFKFQFFSYKKYLFQLFYIITFLFIMLLFLFRKIMKRSLKYKINNIILLRFCNLFQVAQRDQKFVSKIKLLNSVKVFHVLLKQHYNNSKTLLSLLLIIKTLAKNCKQPFLQYIICLCIRGQYKLLFLWQLFPYKR